MRRLTRPAAIVASGLLLTTPALAAQPATAEPPSPWQTLATDATAPDAAAPSVPDSTWAEHVHQDVELTLHHGQVVVGTILRDNGGSITLVRTDQVVPGAHIRRARAQ